MNYLKSYIIPVTLCSLITLSTHTQNPDTTKILTLEQSAKDWRDNLMSAQKYAQAVQVYADNNTPSLDEMYALLGLTPSASTDDIKKAYRKMAIATHPDKWSGKPNSPEKEAATEIFKNITDAYTALTNPELKEAFEFINSEPNRLDLSKADISEILTALERATTMVETIQNHLVLIKNKNLTEQDLNNLNQQLKKEYLELKNITKNEISLDGKPLALSIREWAKSMQENIQSIANQASDQATNAVARTDKEYRKWLFSNRANITMKIHDDQRTPLQEAIEAHSAEMAENIIAAAKTFNINIETLLQPIKEEYAKNIAQGQKSAAQNIADKVYALNIKELSNNMKLVAEKIDRLHKKN